MTDEELRSRLWESWKNGHFDELYATVEAEVRALRKMCEELADGLAHLQSVYQPSGPPVTLTKITLTEFVEPVTMP